MIEYYNLYFFYINNLAYLTYFNLPSSFNSRTNLLPLLTYTYYNFFLSWISIFASLTLLFSFNLESIIMILLAVFCSVFIPCLSLYLQSLLTSSLYFHFPQFNILLTSISSLHTHFLLALCSRFFYIFNYSFYS